MENKRNLILRTTEAEQELVEAVNAVIQRHSLPCFLVEPIVDRIHRQLIDGKANELTAAKASEAAVAKEDNE
ncbi:MAG: hypothetical protein IJF02_05155 [Oscillospiraceae bacterium]|nr:hypothetical protein [Oscillospiraceae bacterium]MBQ6852369.1 hypothetical protein [Oscillospiraceae bacterium]